MIQVMLLCLLLSSATASNSSDSLDLETRILGLQTGSFYDLNDFNDFDDLKGFKF